MLTTVNEPLYVVRPISAIFQNFQKINKFNKPQLQPYKNP